MPTVSFIVVNFNGGPLLARCLASIQAQRFTDYELIVVDNGSSDASCHDARRDFPTVTFLQYTQNLGFAEANNRALHAATGELIALVNNDATLDPGWSQAMVNRLRSSPEAGAAAGRTLQAQHPDLIDAAGFAFYSCGSALTWRGSPANEFGSEAHAPFGAIPAAAMYRRSTLDRIGFFHAEYFCYYEDTDLAVRMVLWGFPTLYVPDAIAYHVGSYTGKDRSDFHVYHLRRNIEYVYWVDMLGHLAWVNLPLHVVYEGLALSGAALSGQFRVVVKAKLDAWANRHWIVANRKALRDNLVAQGKLRQGQANFWRTARFGLPVAPRIEDLRRRRAKQ